MEDGVLVLMNDEPQVCRESSSRCGSRKPHPDIEGANGGRGGGGGTRKKASFLISVPTSSVHLRPAHQRPQAEAARRHEENEEEF